MSRKWGIIPSAGSGTRIQPLAFSKELLPVGSYSVGSAERPRAISEYLIERMMIAGVTGVCMVISPGKWDIVRYYGAGVGDIFFTYTVQPQPRGLCDALFRVLPLVGNDESVIVGLPDTVWFPSDGLSRLPGDRLSFLLFPVEHPEFYDAVSTDEAGNVRRIFVKQPGIGERWIWGAFSMPVRIMTDLHDLWRKNGGRDEYIGTLVNRYLATGGEALGVRAGEVYVDVGTINGYRDAVAMLSGMGEHSFPECVTGRETGR